MRSITLAPRTVALSVIAVAALALTGCATSGGGTSSGDVLTFAGDGEAPAKAVIAAFEKANPGVTVKTTFANDDAAYQQTLRTQLSAGTAPDVFRIWPGGGNTTAARTLGDDGLLLPLGKEAWASKLSSSQKSVSSNASGQLVAIPTTVVAIGAIWNDQALTASGLTAPTTWDGVLDFCSAAKAKGTVAFALGLKDAWVTQLVPYALTASEVYGPEPDFTKQQLAGKASFADSGWKKAIDQYSDMEQAGCFNADPNGVSYDEQMQMLGQGKALGAVQVTASAASAAESAPSGTTFSMTALPGSNSAAKTYLPVSVGIEYAVNAKAKNPTLAKKFLSFLATSEAQAIYAKASSAAPALPSTDFTADAVLKPVAEYQADGKDRPFPDVFWPNAKVQGNLFTSLQNLFAGSTTPADVVKQMDQDFDRK